jgi:hypothetical protein
VGGVGGGYVRLGAGAVYTCHWPISSTSTCEGINNRTIRMHESCRVTTKQILGGGVLHCEKMVMGGWGVGGWVGGGELYTLPMSSTST